MNFQSSLFAPIRLGGGSIRPPIRQNNLFSVHWSHSGAIPDLSGQNLWRGGGAEAQVAKIIGGGTKLQKTVSVT